MALKTDLFECVGDPFGDICSREFWTKYVDCDFVFSDGVSMQYISVHELLFIWISESLKIFVGNPRCAIARRMVRYNLFLRSGNNN